MGNSYLSKRRRQAIMRQLASETGWTCHYCGRPLVEAGQEHWESYQSSDLLKFPTLDHKIARSNGGLNRPENLVLCCRVCNIGKGRRFTYKEWKEMTG